MNVVEKALADHVQPKGFLAQLKEAGASSMEPKEYVKQLTQRSQETQTVRSGETGSVAREPEDEEQQTSKRLT